MPRIAYVEHTFSAASLATIKYARGICDEYARQGFTLTLRQLYYQFVARGLLANKDTEYKRLGATVNDARLAGLLDWDYLEDRTRNVRATSHWDTPAQVIDSAAHSYRRDKWAGQPAYVEVWIEKDALIGVIERVCRTNDVPYFSCRGYTSQSEAWGAAQRLRRACEGQGEQGRDRQPIILHLGDHDPSGIDMTRDIRDRLTLFLDHDTDGEIVPEVRRLALNLPQVRQHNPPPNPAKVTDSRAAGYIKRYGDESWELDALEPAALEQLIQQEIDAVRDPDLWDAASDQERQERATVRAAARRWPEIAALLDDRDPEGQE